MIRELRLRDLGVIADATIELDGGLTAITGETGAGKTMLLTGLGLLLGGRADPSAVRPGADLAVVEGRLTLGRAAREIAEQAGAFFEDDDDVVVARSVASAGRSRAHLGGRAVPAGVLAEIGSQLLTVHGQADQIRLRAPAQQRAALDSYAGAAQDRALAELVTAYARHRELAQVLQRWESESAERAAELQRLTHMLAHIDDVAPVAGELQQLREESERLDNVEALASAASGARTALDGSDGTEAGGVVAGLEQARRALASAADHDQQLQELADRVDGLLHAVNDIVTETGSYAAALEADPQRLEHLHQRRALVTDLMRRYLPTDDHDEVAALLELADSARNRLAQLTAPGAGLDGLREEFQQAQQALTAAAATVTRNRREAASRLADQVDAELAGLQMPGAQLHIQVNPRVEIASHGADDVEFQLQAHPGATARPLAKGASGGELSRIMLAIEVSLAEARHDGRLPVMIFDEVDAGVGGRAAVEVGRRLAQLAQHTQVIVVTHLAQVAAVADSQLVVAKDSDGQEVSTVVRAVSGPQREREIARMLSGEDSETARKHAAELLS
ncbi:MAG: DNA repair protein RecN [Beutenbergiaceae bacterium]